MNWRWNSYKTIAVVGCTHIHNIKSQSIWSTVLSNSQHYGLSPYYVITILVSINVIYCGRSCFLYLVSDKSLWHIGDHCSSDINRITDLIFCITNTIFLHMERRPDPGDIAPCSALKESQTEHPPLSRPRVISPMESRPNSEPDTPCPLYLWNVYHLAIYPRHT